MSRRLDIQGLRAFAVLGVVAYHAGLHVPGGFTGVDVFFVISGFVITAMLRREHDERGRIDFRAFYLRRFKRLTPALAVVVVLTAIGAELMLSPLGPQQTVSETGLGAMFLVANWVIASNTGGYFDAPASGNPLLHTWSLSVEEQFYLVFPALLAVCWLAAPRRRAALVGVSAVLAASLGTALAGLDGFYSPLGRAWEFAAGALAALAAVQVHRRAASLLGLVGAALLVASLVVVDDHARFPGGWTLLPVAGAVLVLLARDGAVSRALASRPAAWLGDRSYSIYLWHWPFIVFATVLWPGTPHARTAAAAAALVPAVASYRFVEQPLRTLRVLPRRRVAVLAAAFVAAPMLLAGGMGSAATSFWTPRYESGRMPVANAGDLGHGAFYAYLQRTSVPCEPKALRQRALMWNGVIRCRQSKPRRAVDVAIVGDSHAEHLFLGLADALPGDNVAYYIVDDAPTMADAAFARIVEHAASTKSVRAVVVNAFWEQRRIDPEGLDATLETLRHAGKRVFVTDDVPSFSFDPFDCKYRKALFLRSDCTTDAAAFRDEYERWFPRLRTAVQHVAGVSLLRTTRFFCGPAACSMARGGKLMFRDYNHLNVNGSRFVAERLLRDYPAFAAAVETSR
jgi:peptidoglycan/LPS O-acetylase OafA/YrhL